MFSEIGGWFVRKAHLAKLALKVKSPTICVVTGTVGMAVAGGIACVQTVKHIDEILDKHNEEMAKVREVKTKTESGEIVLKDEDKDVVKRATVGVYIKTGLRCAKVYAVPFIMMAGSAALILYGHHILKNRHAIALAAYSTLEDRFKTYRQRVKKRIGDEEEEMLYTGAEKRIVDVLDEKTGEVKAEEKTVVVDRSANLGQYSFIFDIANAPYTYSNKPGQNLLFLMVQQDTLNRQLRAKGYVSLNQALESLGMDPVREGQFVGWIYDKNSIDEAVINLGIIAGANDTDDPGYYGGGAPDYILNFNCNRNLEAYFAKKQILKARTKPKVFVKKSNKLRKGA